MEDDEQIHISKRRRSESNEGMVKEKAQLCFKLSERIGTDENII